jgi:hypothetical protein
VKFELNKAASDVASLALSRPRYRGQLYVLHEINAESVPGLGVTIPDDLLAHASSTTFPAR